MKIYETNLGNMKSIRLPFENKALFETLKRRLDANKPLYSLDRATQKLARQVVNVRFEAKNIHFQLDGLDNTLDIWHRLGKKDTFVTPDTLTNG